MASSGAPKYNIVDIEWEAQLPGHPPIRVNGTIQDVARALAEIDADAVADMLGSPTIKPRSELHERKQVQGITCYRNRGLAVVSAIEEGIQYLRGVSGEPISGPGPNECGRVSCSRSSAIYWCNEVSLKISLLLRIGRDL